MSSIPFATQGAKWASRNATTLALSAIATAVVGVNVFTLVSLMMGLADVRATGPDGCSHGFLWAAWSPSARTGSSLQLLTTMVADLCWRTLTRPPRACRCRAQGAEAQAAVAGVYVGFSVLIAVYLSLVAFFTVGPNK